MKQLISILLITISSYSVAQCDVTTLSCCSYQLVDTLDQSEFTAIDTSPHTSITPPPGYAVHFTQPPIMKVYNDGSGLIFASGETVDIVNDETQFSGNYLSRFGDSFIYRNGIYSGSFWHNYQCVYNGETILTVPPYVSSGRIYVTSTYPITGGGTDAKLIFIFTYELIPY